MKKVFIPFEVKGRIQKTSTHKLKLNQLLNDRVPYQSDMILLLFYQARVKLKQRKMVYINEYLTVTE
jgi:hypothetical protein